MDYQELLRECRISAKEEVSEAKALTSKLVMDIVGKLSVAAQGEKVRISDIIKQVRNETGKDYFTVQSKYAKTTVDISDQDIYELDAFLYKAMTEQQ